MPPSFFFLLTNMRQTLWVLILLITWLPMMLTTFRNCYLLKLPLLLFSAPLMTVVRPIVSIAYQAKGLFTRKNNYTTII